MSNPSRLSNIELGQKEAIQSREQLQRCPTFHKAPLGPAPTLPETAGPAECLWYTG